MWWPENMCRWRFCKWNGHKHVNFARRNFCVLYFVQKIIPSMFSRCLCVFYAKILFRNFQYLNNAATKFWFFRSHKQPQQIDSAIQLQNPNYSALFFAIQNELLCQIKTKMFFRQWKFNKCGRKYLTVDLRYSLFFCDILRH